MAREIWKGSITFGLVEIPVGLVAAESSKSVKLTYLDRRDFSPVGYKRYNKTTDREVAWSDITRGFEYEKGQYVVLTEQDLERASPELTRTIAIQQFVDASEIEPIFYETPYYLAPAKPKSKGYLLLRETLRRTGRVGIAKVAIRTREHIAAVSVRGPALVLYLLRFADEIRDPDELANVDVELKSAGVQPREIEMAGRLVDDMTEKWDPAQYSDEYADDLMKLVESRIESGDMHVLDESETKRPARTREAADLMPLLKKSLEAVRGRSARRTAEPRDGRAARSRTRARPRKPVGRSGSRSAHRRRQA